MKTIAKIIIKDKLTNKLIALKLKEETVLKRVISILQSRYEHLQEKNIALFFRGEELNLEISLKEFISEKKYTEKDRIEVREKAESALTEVPGAEVDFIALMKQGGEHLDKAILLILQKSNIIHQELADSALKVAQQENQSLITTLIKGAYLLEKDILQAISRELDVASVDLRKVSVPSDVLKSVPKNICEYYGILPVSIDKGVLSVAVVNPFDVEKLHDLSLVTEMEIEPLLSTEFSIQYKIDYLYQEESDIEEEDIEIDDSEESSILEAQVEGIDNDIDVEAKESKPGIWEAPTMVENKDTSDEEAVAPIEPLGPSESSSSEEANIDLNDFLETDSGSEEKLEEAEPLDIAMGEEIPLFGGASPEDMEASESSVESEIYSGNEEDLFSGPPSTLREEISPEKSKVTLEEKGMEMTEEEKLIEHSIRSEFLDTTILGPELAQSAMSSIPDITEVVTRNDSLVAPGEVSQQSSEELEVEMEASNEIEEAENNDEESSGDLVIEGDSTPSEEEAEDQVEDETLEAGSFQNEVQEKKDSLVEEPESSDKETRPINEEKGSLSKKVSSSLAKIQRNIVVRYYQKMSPFKNFPLTTLFSAEEIKDLRKSQDSIQQTSNTKLTLKKTESLLKVVAQFPGCIVTPSESWVDVSEEESSVKMWVTPLTEGHLEDASIQVFAQGKCLKEIPLAVSVSKQLPAKIAFFSGLILPILSFAYEVSKSQLLNSSSQLVGEATSFIQKSAAPLGGVGDLGLILGGISILFALSLYLGNKNKRAKPLVDFLET